jgi:GT2 family glycosyltransferase
MFFRTSVFKELGGFDERFFMYLEDCDIARRVSEKYKALFYPMADVIHLWERESKRSKKLLLIHVQSIIKYFLKWGLEF